ncbi:isoprenoid synthase domain-containing protein [Suillus subalutaceus]|uniref:isoprenoid synthase domain-containing protein n=1 Tax=Suillus subalutaceus TaxID=48586 RepID=UPI001B87AD28|nr:isoprenoid synthase domain-containing protein [Suillus subalutaceus]KAG1848727.1 isoprenoid synthase domain-containing protein [Suillus subalutaceus]
MMRANIEKYDSFLSSLCASSSSTWTEAQESALLEPYTYITANPGKKVSDKLIEGFNLWLNVPKDKLAVIIRVAALLHNATLLVDDIEDDSQLRRGIPVAHKIYGIPQTINTANYIYFLACQELSALRPTKRRRACDSSASPDSRLRDNSPTAERPNFPKRLISDHDLDRVVSDELVSLHHGQGLDILWRDTLRCPTEDEYVQMAKGKAGGLVRTAVKVMMACATTNTNVDYIPLCNLIMVYYQIRDDYMNLQSDQYMNNKGFADDLSEGKFSFPIVHGILEQPENQLIMNVLQKRPKTPTLKHHAIEYLRNTTKSFDYTLAVLKKLEQQARRELERLGGNPMLSALLDKLHVDT